MVSNVMFISFTVEVCASLSSGASEEKQVIICGGGVIG
jgi:hypothetical protein